VLFAWYSADIVDKTNVVLQETNLMWPISVTDCKESCEVVLSASKTEETFFIQQMYSKCQRNQTVLKMISPKVKRWADALTYMRPETSQPTRPRNTNIEMFGLLEKRGDQRETNQVELPNINNRCAHFLSVRLEPRKLQRRLCWTRWIEVGTTLPMLYNGPTYS
jgi:hypothetical protein